MTEATITVWTKGYADADGKGWIKAHPLVTRQEADALARERFGSFARVMSVQSPRPAGPPVSEAYARAMSRNDNS